MVDKTNEWLSKLPDNPLHQDRLTEILLAQERLCESLGLRGRQQELINELLSLFESINNQAKLAEVYIRQGELYILLQKYHLAEEALNKSLQISKNLTDEVTERNALRSLGLLRWYQGRNKEALAYIEKFLSIEQNRDDIEAIIGDLGNFGNVLKDMGKFERARTTLEEALKLSETLSLDGSNYEFIVKRTYILHVLSTVHRALGDMDSAFTYIRQAINTTTKHRLPGQQSYHLTTLAHLCLQEGKVEESLQHYKKAVTLYRKTRHAALSHTLRILGEVLLGLDRH